jgi:hypothetical protein
MASAWHGFRVVMGSHGLYASADVLACESIAQVCGSRMSLDMYCMCYRIRHCSSRATKWTYSWWKQVCCRQDGVLRAYGALKTGAGLHQQDYGIYTNAAKERPVAGKMAYYAPMNE